MPSTAPPEPPVVPEPPAEPMAKAAISSVQMIQDCPDNKDPWRPKPDKPFPAQAPAQDPTPAAKPSSPMPMSPPKEAQGDSLQDMDIAPGAAARGFTGELEQPCTQSTLQLAFADQGKIEGKVEVNAVRMLDPSGKEVATIEAREPAAWAGSSYEAWNETLKPGQSVNTSYKLSVPDWSKVEKAIGKSSYGFMFILEVDVSVGGELQTVRSAQFPREEPHVIVT